MRWEQTARREPVQSLRVQSLPVLPEPEQDQPELGLQPVLLEPGQGQPEPALRRVLLEPGQGQSEPELRWVLPEPVQVEPPAAARPAR